MPRSGKNFEQSAGGLIMTDDLVARLNAVATMLQFDPRMGEANQRWVRTRIDHRDWMDFDATQLSEMLPPCLRRWILDDRGNEPAQFDG
jgi:hypothetical protein